MSKDDFENSIRQKIEQFERSEKVDTEVLFRKLESRQQHTREAKKMYLYRYAAAILFVAIVTSAFVWIHVQKSSLSTIIKVDDVKYNRSESHTREYLPGMNEKTEQWNGIEEKTVGEDEFEDLMTVDNPAIAGLFANPDIANAYNNN